MHGQVQQMFNEGVIKQSEAGGFEAVMNPAESEHIKSVIAEQSKRRPINEAEIDRINASIAFEEQKR